MCQPGKSSKTLHGQLNLARLAALQCEPLLNKALYQVTLISLSPLTPQPGSVGCRSYLWRHCPGGRPCQHPHPTPLDESFAKLCPIEDMCWLHHLNHQVLPRVPVEVQICREVPIWVLTVSHLTIDCHQIRFS